jgi:hypothetical protein
MPKKTYPDRALETRLRERGATVLCLWELRGPKNTSVAWITCYSVHAPDGRYSGIIIVETFKDGGWLDFKASETADINATLDTYAPKKEINTNG